MRGSPAGADEAVGEEVCAAESGAIKAAVVGTVVAGVAAVAVAIVAVGGIGVGGAIAGVFVVAIEEGFADFVGDEGLVAVPGILLLLDRTVAGDGDGGKRLLRGGGGSVQAHLIL